MGNYDAFFRNGVANGRWAALINGRPRLYGSNAEVRRTESSFDIPDAIVAGSTTINSGETLMRVHITDAELTLLSLQEDLNISLADWEANKDRFDYDVYVPANGQFTLNDLPIDADSFALICQIEDGEAETLLVRGDSISAPHVYTVDVATGIVTVHSGLNGRDVRCVEFSADASSGFSVTLPNYALPGEVKGYMLQTLSGGIGSEIGHAVWRFPKLMRVGNEVGFGGDTKGKGKDNERVYNVQAGYRPKISVYWE